MTTLYFSPGACSLATHIALEETGGSYELARVDLRAKRLEDGSDYREVNPKGSVPALRLDSGEVLTENAILLQYIADQTPGAGLLPPQGTLHRYRVLEWTNFVTTELHKGFGPLFKPDTPDDYKPIVMENLANKFAVLAARLHEGPYLGGQDYSIADIYAFVMGRWAGAMKVDLSRSLDLYDYFARLAERPAVRAALASEGLS